MSSAMNKCRMLGINVVCLGGGMSSAVKKCLLARNVVCYKKCLPSRARGSVYILSISFDRNIAAKRRLL